MQQIDVCIYEILAIEELSEIRYFIPLSKEISAEFIDEQKLQLTRFEIVEAIVNMLRFYMGKNQNVIHNQCYRNVTCLLRNLRFFQPNTGLAHLRVSVCL